MNAINSCARCKGKGFSHPKTPDAFPNMCASCKGSPLTILRIASVIDEEPRTLRNLYAGKRTVAKVAERVFRKLVAHYPWALS